jgi:peptidoglycan hydrolase-like protein with peptidoglycan-binding domain
MIEEVNQDSDIMTSNDFISITQERRVISMKKYLFLALAVCVSFSIFGCAKKEEPLEQLQEPLSMDTLNAMNTTATESKPLASDLASPAVQTSASANLDSKLGSLPPSGPYKPTTKEIQAALKNAGYYSAAIDGKVGPKTKKAIEDFQKANGLKVDGKVGPKTWAVLEKSSAKPVTATSTSTEKTVSLKLR